MSLNQRDKKQILKLSAKGCSPEDEVEICSNASGCAGGSNIIALRVGRLFEVYLVMPMWEKLLATFMVDCVSDRRHRLMDDTSNLRRVDDLLDRADESMGIPLLDLKRRIKERMAKEYNTDADKPWSNREAGRRWARSSL